MIKKLLILMVFGSSLYAQDIRLLDIETIYIIPNGDEKETKQFIEKIPKEIGWLIVNDKSKADAMWAYTMDSEGIGNVSTSPGMVIPVVDTHKRVMVLTMDNEILWRHDKNSWTKIAGDAVKKLKKDLAALR